MKILSIKTCTKNFEDLIILEIEGYPHSSPVFSASISPEELDIALRAWKINQDRVDELNALALPALDPSTRTISFDDKLIDKIGKEIV